MNLERRSRNRGRELTTDDTDEHGFLLSVQSVQSVVEKSSQPASKFGYCRASFRLSSLRSSRLPAEASAQAGHCVFIASPKAPTIPEAVPTSLRHARTLHALVAALPRRAFCLFRGYLDCVLTC
jgi:hypothetical protein